MANKEIKVGIQNGDRETLYYKPFVDRKTGQTIGSVATSIANFTMKRIGIGRKAVFMEEERSDDVEFWLVEFHNHKGKRKLNIPIKDFSDTKSFQQLVMKHDGSFTGTSAHLADWMCKLEMENNEEEIEYYIIESLYGRWFIGDKDVWVFRNGFYMDDTFEPMKDFLRYEGGKKGLMMEMKDNKDMAPFFDESIDEIPDKFSEIEDIFISLKEFFIDDPIVMTYILSFYASSLRYSDFFKALGIRKHPILQISGKTSTGKTELFTALLNKLVGLQDVDAGSWHSSSPFVNEKSLALVSHFPLIRDEYRETGKENARKMELIRAAFNRVPVKKGTANLDLVGFPVRSTLILLGENAPSDPANRNRCISVTMGSKDKVSTARWTEIKDESRDWFRFFLYVVNKKIDVARAKKEYNYFISKIKTADRTGENYSQLLTVYASIFVEAVGPTRKIILDSLISGTIDYLKGFKDDDSEDDNVAQFMSNFETTIAKSGGRLMMNDYMKFDEDCVSLWISGMENVMDSGQKEKVLNPKAIRNILKKEHDAISRVNTRIGSSQITRSCVQIKRATCPDAILEFEDKMASEEKNIILNDLTRYK